MGSSVHDVPSDKVDDLSSDKTTPVSGCAETCTHDTTQRTRCVDKTYPVVRELGQPIPGCAHSVSVCLPSWQDCIDYEEGDERVWSRLRAGYPRFCVPASVLELIGHCKALYCAPGHDCFVFPSRPIAERCVNFITSNTQSSEAWATPPAVISCEVYNIYLASFPEETKPLAKAFWQHTGQGLSSRLAETLLQNKKLLSAKEKNPLNAGGQVEDWHDTPADLPVKNNLRERLADLQSEASSNVYLFQSGMSAVSNTHRLLTNQNPGRRSVLIGFPYMDTLKVLHRFGAGCHFLGYGNQADIERLSEILKSEPIAAIFSEFPTNPLLSSVDLKKIADLAQQYNVPLVVDDTLSCFGTHVSQVADIALTSLTKMFSGSCNVMGGSAVLNSRSKLYSTLKTMFDEGYEDNLYSLDARALESASCCVRQRVAVASRNAEALCEALMAHPKVHHVYFPKANDQSAYDALRKTGSGYGCLLSFDLRDESKAEVFMNALDVSKGPSLGTNFTLVCPYTILAYYQELDFAAKYGISRYLIRVSVGMENCADIIDKFTKALEVA